MTRPSARPAAGRLALSTGATVHGVPVKGMFVVGRASTCTLALDSNRVSRLHAQFWIEHEAMWVEDLGSRNGVTVNGKKIDGRTRLEIGDRVLVGDRTLDVTVRPSDRNPTMPVMEAAPDGEIEPESRERVRDDDTAPISLERETPLRKFLDVASAALQNGNHHDAADAMRHFCETVEETAHLGGTDRGALESATRVLLGLAEATSDASWIERMFAACQRMAIPLDVAATERASELIGALPPVPDLARRSYVTWMKQQQLRFPQREAIKRLAEVRGTKRPAK